MALNIHTGPVQRDGRTTLWDWRRCSETMLDIKIWCGTTALQNWHFMAVQRNLRATDVGLVGTVTNYWRYKC